MEAFTSPPVPPAIFVSRAILAARRSCAEILSSRPASVTAWDSCGTRRQATYGLPTMAAITGSDGAVYVSDDATGNIYKVAYTGPRINPGGFVQRATGIYELYGANLANDTRNFGIYADGVRLDTLYISAGQVNFVLPAEAMLHISQ